MSARRHRERERDQVAVWEVTDGEIATLYDGESSGTGLRACSG